MAWRGMGALKTDGLRTRRNVQRIFQEVGQINQKVLEKQITGSCLYYPGPFTCPQCFLSRLTVIRERVRAGTVRLRFRVAAGNLPKSRAGAMPAIAASRAVCGRPGCMRRMHMHRATHAITGVEITVMIKQLVMIMSLMILMIAQRQAALAMRVVLPPALPPRAPAPPRAPRACAAPSCRAAAPVRPRVRPRVRTYVRRSCVSQGGRVRVGPGVSAPGCVDARRRRRRRRARRGSPATCYRRICCGR